jgi:hypothetical protein
VHRGNRGAKSGDDFTSGGVVVGAGMDADTARGEFAEQAVYGGGWSAVGAHQGECTGAELVGGGDYDRWVLANMHVGGFAVERP